MASLNLLGSLSRVITPFIKITIGKYTFGVYNKTTISNYDEKGIYKQHNITYPNYVQDLNIVKINGQVNTYTLTIKYPITEGDDPNFFEKVFSSVSRTRKIVFSYGDLSTPKYIYKEEEAIILDVKSSISVREPCITYTVKAVSCATLAVSGTFNFEAKYAKPSDEIKRLLLTNSLYGLQDIFYGMRNYKKVISDGLIDSSDMPVMLEYKSRTSLFDYLTYLVNCMIPLGADTNSNKNKSYYALTVIDDISGVYGGPYFKVSRVDKDTDSFGAYEIDIGYPSQNIVTDFVVEDDNAYSIYYDWQGKLNSNEYSYRINRDGKLEAVYSPRISSNNDKFDTRTVDKVWWSKVTEFPIKIKITLTGLLRPAILMTHVRLNVYFYGKKHASSGLYIITQQQDSLGVSGVFKTTLSLTRVAGDKE